MADTLHFEDWTCPLPLRSYPRIVLGHGGGGKLSEELIENLFLPAFRNSMLEMLGDASVVDLPSGRVALTTDSFVVRPLVFPGGSIGELAVNGTVNDLAMCGARPLYLTAGFILEEGLEMALLAHVVERMAQAAHTAGVQIVAGDTKVVEKGHGDGIFINTAGVGLVPPGLLLGPAFARPGDRVIVSGTLGDHGIAVMSVRQGLQFETTIESDCAALHGLVAEILQVEGAVHALRDPTRGGLAATLNEIARASQVGMMLDETAIPVDRQVRAACELLGLDPLQVANEGKLVAVVAGDRAAEVLRRMREHPLGQRAAVIGEVTAARPGLVAATTSMGGTRVIPLPVGEQLPRIC
ncbi:hydrogenase expression/formation protein HypE [uncultured Paludibaculum sp.]|uniref:hydrogenase expression/formation protein HypE n=1 Tax=uncultured Paludibaculum sp. TaxID=1765020 RepID=UPI002AAC3714|nr:hydrogenase expression/formation protein HypE [uncultured Paludibaculum sp.]